MEVFTLLSVSWGWDTAQIFRVCEDILRSLGSFLQLNLFKKVLTGRKPNITVKDSFSVNWDFSQSIFDFWLLCLLIQSTRRSFHLFCQFPDPRWRFTLLCCFLFLSEILFLLFFWGLSALQSCLFMNKLSGVSSSICLLPFVPWIRVLHHNSWQFQHNFRFWRDQESRTPEWVL